MYLRYDSFLCYCFGVARKRKKNQAASTLAKIRWKRMTKQARSEFMRAAVNKRWEYRAQREAESPEGA